MKTRQRAVSLLLALVMMLGFIPASATVAVADASGVPGLTITQTAAWNKSVQGNIVADVTLAITSTVDLQTPKDVVFVIDHSASQNLSGLQADAKLLAGMLDSVPGMRYALVSYASAAERKLNFTTDVSQLNAAIDSIPEGANCNAYAGLLEAQRLIDSRGNAPQPACIVLLSNGRFNMNLEKTKEIGRELKAALPVYGTRDGSTDWKKTVCTALLDITGIAMEIGESRRVSLTVKGQLDTTNFTPTTASKGTYIRSGDDAGAYSYTADIRMGESLNLTFSGRLTDNTQIGSLSVAGTASAEAGELRADALPCGLERSGNTVVYLKDDEADGEPPKDGAVYQSNDIVVLKPCNMTKPDWNLSGWVDGDDSSLVNSRFPITKNVVELDSSWGRAFVRISTENVNTKIQGKRMMSQYDIWNKSGLARAFYNTTYSGKIVSITLQDRVDIPPNTDPKLIWDITDTKVTGNQTGAVMAWLVPNQADSSKYDLYIGGRDGLEAPADCSNLFNINGSKSNFLQQIDGLNILDTSNVTTMYQMFAYCNNLTSLDLSSFDTSKVKNLGSTFNNCSKLKELSFGEKWDTSSVSDFSTTFAGCKALTSLDLSKWKTPSLKTTNNMFSNCNALNTITFGTGWDVSKATNMGYMFYNCSALTALDLNGWKLNEDEDVKLSIQGIFNTCTSLQTLHIDQWNTSRVTNMDDVFQGCSSLTTLSISQWDTSNVIVMRNMFDGCSSLTSLDLSSSSWNMRQVKFMAEMFKGCTKLTTINKSRIEVAKGCTAYDCFKGSGLTNVTIYANNGSGVYNDPVGTGSSSTSRANDLQSIDNGLGDFSFEPEEATPEEVTPEENTPEENTPEEETPEENTPEEETPEENTPEEETPEEETPEEETPEENTPEEETPEEETPEEETPEENIPEEETPEENTPEEETPEEETPEENIPEENTPEEEDNLLISRVVRSVTETAYSSAARAADYNKKDGNNRPVYAITKDGTWDCGEVEVSDVIKYTLELQYLSQTNKQNKQYDGVSGTLTVTNPIPAGLVLDPGSIEVTPVARRIDETDAGATKGVMVQAPSVSNGVLTFTVDGLSTGAMYQVSYECMVPAAGNGGYTQFLNTASVEDNGIVDFADPVLHYMGELAGQTLCTVTYEYDVSTTPAGWKAPPAQTYTSGTAITLPRPSMFGYKFNGWVLDGQTYQPGALYTVEENVKFTGSWKKEDPAVEVSYAFTGDCPSYADTILETLNADKLKYHANTFAAAPVVFANSDEYTFSWNGVDDAGRFNVGPGPEKVVTGTWKKQQYSVTYEYAGAPADAAGLPAAEQYAWGTPVSLADEPSNTKTHLFQGWSMGGSELESTFEMPAEDVTITGTWIARPAAQEQEVLIDPNGGTWKGSDLQVVMSLTDYQAQKGSLPDPVMDGKVFQEWTEKADPTGDFALIVTARWEGEAAPPDDPAPVDPKPEDPAPDDPKPEDPTPPTPVPPTPVPPTPVPPTPVPPTPVPPTLPSSPSSGMNWHVITATAGEGGTITPSGRVSVSRGASQTFIIQPAAGCSIQNVIVDGRSVGAVNSYTFDNVWANHTIEASFAQDRTGSQVKWLNTRDHIAHLHGFPDETFRPDSYMTRGEAAQMFYNLLEVRISAASAGYSDIPAGMWYETAVNVLHELGVMVGDGQGRFGPDRPITRAEFTAAAMKFSTQAVSSPTRFADVNEEDWFFNPVMDAAGQGWITGYSDGTFRPGAPIARAEAAAIVNRMLNRTADTNTVDLYPDKLRQFSDVTEGCWAYYDIMEAANTHDYDLDQRNAEIWKGFAP